MTFALQALAAKAFAHSVTLRHRLRNAGEVADFIDWQTIQFDRPTIYWSRERLWSALLCRMDPGRPWHGIEFGVAWGYATGWWLQRLPYTSGSSWDGFDRFTGLPRAWHDLEERAFDAGGHIPSISDPRLTWHVGDVEVTLADLDQAKVSDGGLRGAKTPTRHAATAWYSWIRPPRRSRRLTFGTTPTGSTWLCLSGTRKSMPRWGRSAL